MQYRGEELQEGGGGSDVGMGILLALVPLALVVALGLVAFEWFRHRRSIQLGEFFALWGALIGGGAALSVIVLMAFLLAAFLALLLTGVVALGVALWSGVSFGEVMKENGSSLYSLFLLFTCMGGLWFWVRDK